VMSALLVGTLAWNAAMPVRSSAVVNRFAAPASRVVMPSMLTSAVMDKVSDWCDMSIILPHEAFRVLIMKLPNIKIKSPEDAAVFEGWWNDYFIPIIGEHHEAEEKIYFPWVESKAGKCPTSFETGHETLNTGMAEIASLAAVAAAGEPGPFAFLPFVGYKEGKAVEAKLSEFYTFLVGHLSEEEEWVPNALRTNGFDPSEEAAVVPQIVKSLTVPAKVLPLFAYAIDSSEGTMAPLTSSDMWIARLPPPLQEAMPGMIEALKKDNLAVVDSLC